MSFKRDVNAFDCADSYFNCFILGGCLSAAYDIATINDVPLQDAIYAAYSPAAGRYIFCSRDKIAYTASGGVIRAYSGPSCSAAFMVEEFVEGVPTAIVFRGIENSRIDSDVTRYEIYINKKFSCGAVHCGRLFAASELVLWWTSDEVFNDVMADSYGKLDLDFKRGNVLNLLVFDGKLIAVREYGLTVFSMYGSPDDFSVDLTDTDCDLIYKNTACVVGDKLYFFSESGLKIFDGSKISDAGLKYALSSPRSAVSYGGIYYLACHSDKVDKDVILCLDTSNKSICVVDEKAEFLFIKDGVQFIGDGKLKQLKRRNTVEESSSPYYFSSNDINFGTDGFKTVIKIEASDAAMFTVSNERFTRVYQLEKGGAVFPHLKGKSFKVTAEGVHDVKSLILTAEVRDGH